MAEILNAELQIDRLISADPTNGVIAALNNSGAVVNLLAWDPASGDVTHSAPAGSGSNLRRHLFDRPIVVDAQVNQFGAAGIQHSWNAAYKAVEFGPNAAIFYRTVTDEIYLYSGLYNDTLDRYSRAGLGAVYSMSIGVHAWHTAPTGAADAAATVSEKMRLTNIGILLLGTVVAANAVAGEAILAYQKYVRGVSEAASNTIGLLRVTGWGYSPNTYPVAQVGAPGISTALGCDPSTNANGNFSGDGREVILPNPMRFAQSNAAQTAWKYPFQLNDGIAGFGSPGSFTGAVEGDAVLPAGRGLRSSNIAGTNTVQLIYLDGNERSVIASDTYAVLGAVGYRSAASHNSGTASMNGAFGIDTTNNRFIFFANGNRYYIAADGTF